MVRFIMIWQLRNRLRDLHKEIAYEENAAYLGMGEKSYLNLRLEQLRVEMRQTEARLYRLMP